MKSYPTSGIVLHTVKYGESSLVVYMLTQSHGRQTYMVQGVGGKTGRSRQALLQPIFLLDFIGLESSKAQMHRIKDVRASVPLITIPFDVRKSTISLFMAELIYRMVREVEPESPLFDFVKDSVLALDSMQEGISNFHLWFLVALSRYLGYYPGNEYTEGGYFDIGEGLFTPLLPEHRFVMDRENSALLSRLMDADSESLPGIKLSGKQRSAFLNAMVSYIGYHLDTIHQVRSIRIFADMF